MPSPDTLDPLLARLPRAVAPARDLWPGVEAAIRPAPARQWPLQLAAGLLVAAVSVTLALGFAHRLPLPADARAPAGGNEAALLAARFLPPQDPGYRAARAALERTFRERLVLLAPKTRLRIEADLETIQRANADIRAALEQDPASPVLQRLLESTWQQEFDLYRSVARSTEPLSRRT
ncbi:MAG: hypothetical protein U1F06_11015 [Steroidobacteraceae bacterium]